MKFKLEEFVKKHQKSVLSYSDMCSYHGVDVNIFYYRKNKLKLPIEKCLSPVRLKHRYSKKL